MHKVKFLLLIVVLIGTLGTKAPENDVPIVTYDPDYHKHPHLYLNYEDYIAEHEGIPFRINKVYEGLKSGGKGNRVVVIVEESIYDGIDTTIATYKSDLEAEGYTVEIHTVTNSPDCEALRSFLQSKYSEPAGLEGAVLIGDVAVPFYEMDDQPAGWPTYEQFPIDLFYMDLDGEWLDTIPIYGIYDTHPNDGNEGPEIWTGRLYTETMRNREVKPYFCARFFIDGAWTGWDTIASHYDSLRSERNMSAVRKYYATSGGSMLFVNTDASPSKVIEMAPDFSIVWEYSIGLIMAQDAERLSNSNTLITDYGNSRIIEVAPDCTVVWEYKPGTSILYYPEDADRLPNGNTLICDSKHATGHKRVIEVTSGGTIVWEYNIGLIRPGDADRLANGNTLIANTMGDCVIEVTSGGTIVWEYKPGTSVLQDPADADRLANGNTLIANYSRRNVIEVAPDCTIVWQWDAPDNRETNSVERLANGNTVAATNHDIYEVDPDGNIVWEYGTGLWYPGNAHRLPNRYADSVQVKFVYEHLYTSRGHAFGIDNVQIGYVTTLGHDVWAKSFDTPLVVPENITCAPRATVKNIGANTESFPVTCVINPGSYSSTKNVTSLLPDATTQLVFDNFTFVSGTYDVTVYTQLANDEDRESDTLYTSVKTLPDNWLYYDDGFYDSHNSVIGQTGNLYGYEFWVCNDAWIDTIKAFITTPIPADTATVVLRIYDGGTADTMPTNLRWDSGNFQDSVPRWRQIVVDTTQTRFSAGRKFYTFVEQKGAFPHCGIPGQDSTRDYYELSWQYRTGHGGWHNPAHHLAKGDFMIRVHVILTGGKGMWLSAGSSSDKTPFAANKDYTTQFSELAKDGSFFSDGGSRGIKIVLEEDFESGIPGDWTVVNGNGGNTWVVGTTKNLAGYTPPYYGTKYAYYSDATYQNTGVDELISPAKEIPVQTETIRFKYSIGTCSAVSFLNNYFAKVHKYRTNAILNDRALEYIDDDWTGFAGSIDAAVKLAYDNTWVITDHDGTNAADYRDVRLNQNYAMILLLSHSSVTYHHFKISSGWDGYVYNNDIRDKKPLAYFYNLYACSNCAYDCSGYMGGWYSFADSTAVGATGSTKTGGMWDFAQFYSPLGEHKCHGEALKEWFDYEAPYTQIDPWYKQSRYFGMTLLGDPTLVPRPGGFTSSPYITEAEKTGNNVKLTWRTLSGADHYVVYRNTDPSFVPVHGDSIGTTSDTSYTDPGVVSSSSSFYYLVKGVNAGGSKSTKSNMAYKFNKFFNENPGPTSDKNWVSLPWYSVYSVVSDLTSDLSPSGDPLNAMTNLRDDQLCESWVYDPVFGWIGTDFSITSGRGYELVTISDTVLVFVGANNPAGLVILNENLGAVSDRNWISIPYNAAYSIVSDITAEYSPSGDPMTGLTNLRDDQLCESWVYDPVFGWIGTDFSITSGRGYELVVITDTTWDPTEYTNEAKQVLAQRVKTRGVEVYCGSLTEPVRAPVWQVRDDRKHKSVSKSSDQHINVPESIADLTDRRSKDQNTELHGSVSEQSDKKGVYLDADHYELVSRRRLMDVSKTKAHREVGISHNVFVHLAPEELDNIVFTAYRLNNPADVLTEQLIGCGVVKKNDRAGIWFNTANFKKPWQHAEEVLLIIEATRKDRAYFNVVSFQLNKGVDIQNLGEIALTPIPKAKSRAGLVSLPAIDNEHIVGYSLYQSDTRLNEQVITGNDYAVAGDVNLKPVIRGGYETVYASSEEPLQKSSTNKQIPLAFSFGVYPSPFSKRTRISYGLPKPGAVEVMVYDITGKQVKTLVSERLEPGYYKTVWQGEDVLGRKVSAGVYFILMNTNDFASQRKVIFVH